MFTALAVLLAVPFFLQFVAGQNDCTRTYTVQDGDTCWSISRANSVPSYQLGVVNYDMIDPDCTNLQPGSTLCLGTQGEDCTTTYTVQDGDTCDSVADAYSINGTMLYTNNPQLDQYTCDNLFIGEVVCVASTVLVPPMPNGTLPCSTIPPAQSPALPYCDEI